ncbi:MAG: fumarylacetoacetate hydrolase family protein [Bacteroidales bacterium]|nr:fumarylacetoacetate hydrolase family protein [Bacteroidales bacterium]MDD4576899.1 fumarylacetoacetate hydrolase family protein [Bacteroidales bacterium]
MKLICVGPNYYEFTKEKGFSISAEPLFFMKPDTALLIRNRPFFIPDFSSDIHPEIQLVVKIHKIGRHIQAKFAHKYYNQIALGIDFSAFDLLDQCRKNGNPWEIAKAFDFSAAISDFVPLAGDVQNIAIEMKLNGESVQKVNTKEMIFTVDQIIEHVSKFVTLKIGDLIYTGTSSFAPKINIGDQISGSLEGEELFNFFIK